MFCRSVSDSDCLGRTRRLLIPNGPGGTRNESSLTHQTSSGNPSLTAVHIATPPGWGGGDVRYVFLGGGGGSIGRGAHDALQLATEVAPATEGAQAQAPSPCAEAWPRVLARLQSEVGEAAYHAWLRQLAFGGLDGDEVTLLLPTRFLRDMVQGQFGDRLSALWRHERPEIRRVDLRVAATCPTRTAAPAPARRAGGFA